MVWCDGHICETKGEPELDMSIPGFPLRDFAPLPARKPVARMGPGPRPRGGYRYQHVSRSTVRKSILLYGG